MTINARGARWRATHEISAPPHDHWFVMEVDGFYVTRGIWENNGTPEWAVGPAGQPIFVNDNCKGDDRPTKAAIRHLPQRPQYLDASVVADDIELKAIKGHAQTFGLAIEHTEFDLRTPNMRHFPSDCCGHTCDALLIYFHEIASVGQFEVVLGNFNEDQHIWLRRADLIVDITGDQFGDGVPPVVVTRCSNWHSAWVLDERKTVIATANYIAELKLRPYVTTVYEAILKTLGAPLRQ